MKNSMKIQIRKAVREDCEAIMKLVNELAVYEKAPDEVTVSMDHFVESGFGEKPVWEAFVVVQPPVTASPKPSEGGGQAKMGANIDEEIESMKDTNDFSAKIFPQPSSQFPSNPGRIGGAVLAFALYYIRYSTWKGQRMYLEDLLVTENMRGKGIGKLLFEKLIEECKFKKYSGLVWQVLDWNEPAINFYKKFEGVKFDEGWVNCSVDF